MSAPPLGRVLWIFLSVLLWAVVGFTRSRFAPRGYFFFVTPDLLAHAIFFQAVLCVAAWTALPRSKWRLLVALLFLPGAFIWSRSPPETQGLVIRNVALYLALFSPGLFLLALSAPCRAFLARKRASDVSVRLCLVGGFLLVCGWFRWAEAWREHYFDPGGGWLYLANNAFRLAASAYFFWLHCALGFLVLSVLGAGMRPRSPERFIVAFFAGAAVVQAAMLTLGLSGLFHRGLVWGGGALALALAPTEPLGAVRVLLATMVPRRRDWARSASFLAGTAAATLLLVYKGLFPHCEGGDLATHYFPYYEAVVASHGVGPNEVWYHYYHTKGAGEIFLAILLTDMQGASVASCVYFAVSALVIFALIRGATRQRGWALLAATTYVAAMALGAGEFEMQHVVTMGFASGLVFLANLLDARPERRTAVTPLTGALAAAWVLHVPTAAPLITAVFFLLSVPAAARRDWSLVRSYAVAVISASLSWAVMAGVSYVQTGMLDIVPFRLFWRFADQPTLSRWISPYLMVLLEEGSRPELGAVQPLGLHRISWGYWSEAFRLERVPVLCPHALLFLPLSALAMAAARIDIRRRAATWPLVALGVATLGCGAVNQPVSLLRFSIFLLILAVSMPTLAWSFLARRLTWPRARTIECATAILALLSVVWTFGRFPAEEGATRFRFALGGLSYSQVYERQGRSWSASRSLARTLPAGSRIWSFNVIASMAPAPRFETMVSFSMGPRWHEVLFEPAEHARAVLREEGLDYFLIDTRDRFFDLLPHSPLFRPGEIERWMRVVWHEDGQYVLTWRDRPAPPLPEELLRDYRAQIEESQQVADWKALYERIGSIYRANRGRPYPLRREPGLPAIRGWQ